MTRTPDSSLRGLPGIGDKRLQRLAAAGISTVDELAAADPDDVRTIVRISRQQAHALRSHAAAAILDRDGPTGESATDDWEPSTRRWVFVVTVTTEPGGRPIRTVVRHVGSDRDRHFVGFPAAPVVAFISDAVGVEPSPSAAAGEARDAGGAAAVGERPERDPSSIDRVEAADGTDPAGTTGRIDSPADAASPEASGGIGAAVSARSAGVEDGARRSRSAASEVGRGGSASGGWSAEASGGIGAAVSARSAGVEDGVRGSRSAAFEAGRGGSASGGWSVEASGSGVGEVAGALGSEPWRGSSGSEAGEPTGAGLVGGREGVAAGAASGVSAGFQAAAAGGGGRPGDAVSAVSESGVGGPAGAGSDAGREGFVCGAAAAEAPRAAHGEPLDGAGATASDCAGGDAAGSVSRGSPADLASATGVSVSTLEQSGAAGMGPLSRVRHLRAGLTVGGARRIYRFELGTRGLTQQGLDEIGYRVTLLAREPGERAEVELAQLTGSASAGESVVLEFDVVPPSGVQALTLGVAIAPWFDVDRIPAVGLAA